MVAAVFEPVTIARVDAFAFREPLRRPLALSFGVMRHRSAVFLRVEDKDGAFGWGEVFANWPAAGAEHRCRLLAEDVADLFIGRTYAHPSALFAHLDTATALRALQCGEWGPFRQVIAGLDVAMWDLSARRAGLPLAQFLRADAPGVVPAYASGIHVDAAAEVIAETRAWSFSRFKVKVGFGPGDAARVRDTAAGLRPGEVLMCDANQAWDVETAGTFLRATAECGLGWLEEPIVATAPPEAWRTLAEAAPTPIAAGENLAGLDAFRDAIAAGAITVLQPDLAKWGGITGCQVVAAEARAAGRSYCPHFLGGGIGLAASAHALAAAGGDGVVEVDVNPNPLRDGFMPVATTMTRRGWPLTQAPGLGIEACPDSIAPLQTLAVRCGAAGIEYREGPPT